MSLDFPEIEESLDTVFCLSETFKKKKILGSGNFGKVFLMTSASGKNIAAKTIPNDDRRTAGLVKKEINVMSKLSHPHIVQFLGQSLTQRSSTILMEFVGADITIVVDVMDAEEKRIIFAQLVSAVEYMHDQGFAHCDLKPDNVLVKSTVNVKICDFGGATQIKFDSIGRELPMSGMVGTRNYEAPLKIRRKPSKASKDDIWSLGLILYWLFAEDLPWRVAIKEEDEHYRRWTEDIAPPGFLCLEGEVVQVLSCTLHHVECVRPTAKELGKLPYCRSNMRSLPPGFSEASPSFPMIPPPGFEHLKPKPAF